MLIRLLIYPLIVARNVAYMLARWPRVAMDARNPEACQRRVLRRILNANQNTRLGQDLGLCAIEDYAQYIARVPVHEYEMLRPYVMRQITDGTREAVAEPPVFYAKTSGTTGKPKYIPVSASGVRVLRQALNLMSFRQFVARPSAFFGGLMTLTSRPNEGCLASGIPYGAASGLIYAQTPRLFAKKFVIPPDVLAVEDFELRYLLVLAIGLRRPDVTYFATANPSTVLILQQHLEACTDQLLTGLKHGDFMPDRELPHALRTSLQSFLFAHPRQAARLRKQWQENGRLIIADVWPSIRLLATWTAGSCGMALESARELLPDGITVMDIGYLASELHGTVPLFANNPGGLPTLRDHFFEFVPQAMWEASKERFLRLHELRKGENYYVFVTTPGGLYRYDMNDIVTVTGFFRRTPLLKFMQKGKGVTSITGEKLYESQLLAAWTLIAAETACHAGFLIVIADVAAACYRVYLEAPIPQCQLCTLGASLDKALGEQNVEYREKRLSRRLKGVEMCLLRKGSAEAFRRYLVAAGQRDSQFKMQILCYDKDITFDFESRVISRSWDGTNVA